MSHELEFLFIANKTNDHQSALNLISKHCRENVTNIHLSNEILLSCIKPVIRILIFSTQDIDLKKGILKCILNQVPSKNSLIVNEISVYLAEVLKNHIKIENVIEIMQTISVLLTNSFTVEIIMKKNFDQIVEFYEIAIKNLTAILLSKCSKVSEIEAANKLHTSIQSLILFVDKFSYVDLVSFPCLIYEAVLNLMSCRKLPVSTIYNCGLIVVALNVKFSNNSLSFKLLERFSKLFPTGSLAICYGFLVNSTVDLYSIHCNFKSPISVFIIEFIWEIHTKNMNDSLLIVGVLKIAVLLAKRIIIPKHEDENSLEILIDLVVINLDHYLNTVKNLSKEALHFLIQHKSIVVNSKFLKFLKHTRRIDRKTCIILTALIKTTTFFDIKISYPEVVQDLLKAVANSNSLSYVCQAYMSLMLSTYDDSIANLWFDEWIKPLLVKSNRYNFLLEIVLVPVAKLSTLIRTEILLFCRDVNEINYDIIVKCLLEVKTSDLSDVNDILKNLELDSKIAYWRNFLPIQIMKKALYISGSVSALKTASLIIESCKKNERYTLLELEMLKLFIDAQVTAQKSDVRQKVVNIMKMLFTKMQNNAKGDELANEFSKDIYNDFIQWMVAYCMSNLFPGASYERRSISLKILEHLVTNKMYSVRDFSLEDINVLFACLTDSFEENKRIARNIILLTPLTKKFCNDEDIFALHHLAINMIECVRFTEHSTAAYLLEILCSINQSKICFSEIMSEELTIFFRNKNELNREDSCYMYLVLLLSLLKSRLCKVKESNLVKFPLHGILLTISDSYEPKWTCLVHDILRTFMACNTFAATVVSKSSPEGYLPEGEFLDYNNGNDFNAAQQLLLCSWRSVKEASLLLGDFVEKCAFNKDYPHDSYLNESLFFEIGNHLKTLIYQIKHKGSFKLVYIALCQYCKCCWRISSRKINAIPREWLIEIQNDIMFNGKQLWLLRRGAGIPCIVLAILSTEFNDKHKYKFDLLNEFVPKMLDMLNDENYMIQSKIHALNVLCDLFKHKDLAEEMNSYVEKALIIAINGAKSSNWNEKNTSSLLLSAVLTRVFGVSRSRVEISWKNKMTGKMFFQKYPNLYDVFLAHLCQSETTDAGVQSALYLILLIFARLYPSYDDEWNTTFKLNSFIPYIYRCCGSSIYKIRELAVEAIIPFITTDVYVDHMEKLCFDLMLPLSENTVHGLLIQFDGLLKNRPQLDIDSENKLILILTSILLESDKLLDSDRSYIVKEKFIHILSSILGQYYKFIDAKKMSNYPLNDAILFSKNQILNEQSYLSTIQAFNMGFLYIYLKEDELNHFINMIENMILRNIFLEDCDVLLEFVRIMITDEEFEIENTVFKNFILKNKKKKNLRNKILNSNILYQYLIDNLMRGDIRKFDGILHILRIYIKYSQFENSLLDTFSIFLKKCDFSGKWIVQFFSCMDILLQKSIENEEKYLEILKILFQIVEKSSFSSQNEFEMLILKHYGKDFLQKDDELFLNSWIIVVGRILIVQEEELCYFKYMLSDMKYVDNFLLHKLFSNFCDRLQHNPVLCSVGLLSCVIQELGMTLEEHNKNTVFFNDLPQQFEDHLVICRLACKFLNSLWKNNPLLLSQILPQHLKDWILKRSLCNVSCEKNIFNLRDVISIICNNCNTFLKDICEESLLPRQSIEKQIILNKLSLLRNYL